MLFGDVPMNALMAASIFLGVVSLALIAALVSHTRAAWMMLSAALLWLLLGFFPMAEMAGRPKPSDLEMFRSGEALIHDTIIVHGRAVYVWASWIGEAEPLSYSFAWSKSTEAFSSTLARMIAKRAKEGGRITMTLPYQRSLEDRKPQLRYDDPPPAPPEKRPPEGGGA